MDKDIDDSPSKGPIHSQHPVVLRPHRFLMVFDCWVNARVNFPYMIGRKWCILYGESNIYI